MVKMTTRDAVGFNLKLNALLKKQKMKVAGKEGTLFKDEGLFIADDLEEYFLGKDPRKTKYYKKYAGRK
jgi:hypothetical protein